MVNETERPRALSRCLLRKHHHNLWHNRTTKLDKANERFAEWDDIQLHPTKGWRRLNPKRTAAQMHVAAVLSGGARHEVFECGQVLRAIQ